ncbi:hypothetical protein J1N35_038058 [Gossypium stocksii]|uniref:Retrovirus-related Pol polyprotein from transposon TNT 1-94 n=1 Tax=Gossypium stocksii TaxID=47602 RepID=A0A9D3ULX4_9ROSI|nr:hypothetical protein J1N35_038058 [Gossypium stocksii]
MDISAQIWNSIVDLYGSRTTSRLMFYKRALHSQHKGDLSMKEFLMKIKGYCTSLASCGEVISDHEHITAILNGLPLDYEYVISIITASQMPYTAQGVTTMLLDAETRQLLSAIKASANMVSHQLGKSVDSRESALVYRSSNNVRGRGHGRSSGSRFQCQLCGKQGYLVDRYYYRFHASYNSAGYRPPQPPQASVCMFGTRSTMMPWMSPTLAIVPTAQPSWFLPSAVTVHSAPWSNPFAPTSFPPTHLSHSYSHTTSTTFSICPKQHHDMITRSRVLAKYKLEKADLRPIYQCCVKCWLSRHDWWTVWLIR